MKQSSEKLAIDLPAPPLRTTITEGPLNDALVIAHLLNGDTLRGKLKVLNSSQEILVIHIDSHSHDVDDRAIRFSDLRYLVFTRKLPVTSGDHPIVHFSTEVELPGDLQKYSITFKDEKMIGGETRGVFVDQSGLHIFKPVGSHSVVRIFVPDVSLKTYRIGSLGRNQNMVQAPETPGTTVPDSSTRDFNDSAHVEPNHSVAKHVVECQVEDTPSDEEQQVSHAPEPGELKFHPIETAHLTYNDSNDEQGNPGTDEPNTVESTIANPDRASVGVSKTDQLDKHTDSVNTHFSSSDKPEGHDIHPDLIVNTTQLKDVLDDEIYQLEQEKSAQRQQKLGQLAINEHLISYEQLQQALEVQKQNGDKKIGLVLEDMGVLSDDNLHRVLAHKLGIPFVKLHNFDFDPEAISLVPREVAQKYTLIPLCIYHQKLIVAIDDPTSQEAIGVVQFITSHHLDLVTAAREDIQAAINDNYDKETITEDLLAAEDESASLLRNIDDAKLLSEVKRLGKEKPIVRLVNRVIADAINRRASDIHIRPRENCVDLLFRIDGALIKSRSFNKSLLPAVISRIKIVGKMDIAERRLPQDGRARVSENANVVDLRISVIPTVNGESVVIRLLNTKVGLKSLSDLGFNQHDAEVFTDLLHKSYGLILVTGPTGSGKSTTLYAALKEVMEQNINIITVEDPVEYHIDNIEQIQVNTAPGYTFSRALRHILRHDPDAIMIGEIRDQETAKIAVESALTGHLVLSTLHTNDAAGAVTRLLEMDIDPFLLNATLLGVLAQRLVRRNCIHCLEEESLDPLVRKSLGIADDEVFYKGRGCDQCNGTGYSGRVAVYELLKISENLQSLMQKGITAQAIHTKALEDGMIPLTNNALMQARQHVTSLAEVYRIRLK